MTTRQSAELEIIRVETENADYQAITSLMRTAFPPDERRDESEFCQFVQTKSNFRCNAIKLGGQFVGLLNYWLFDDFVYVEHVAICPELRGREIGSRAIKLLCQMQKPVILEVELPNDDLSARRIAFYERIGFKKWGVRYIQPPYSAGKNSVEMSLMAFGPISEKNCAELVIATLHSEVYGVGRK